MTTYWNPFAVLERELESGPIFRLLEEYDNVRGIPSHGRRGGHRTFQPRFDVRETKEAYELHGELPGIDQKDVEITFTDHGHTLKISGRTERTYTSGTPQGGAIEAGKDKGKITDNSHKATVEDDKLDSNAPTSETSTATIEQQQKKKDVAKHEDGAKFWVSERTVGQFERTFTFPTSVNLDNVKANMKNGVLSIVVPKMAEQGARRIHIE